MAREAKQRDFRLEIKEVTESGTFTGIASVYGLPDLVGDVVERGAFSKTLQERPSVPILWMHDNPVGVGSIEDSPTGLIVNGKLSLGVERARDALELMRDGAVTGLSIGFKTIKFDKVDGLRRLKEVAVFEVSLVPVPALPEAQITSVKKATMEIKTDFTEALDEIQTWAARYNYMQALDTAISECMRDEAVTTDDCITQIGMACDQFKAAMSELAPKYRMLMNESGYDFKKLFDLEKKAGRMLSAANRSKIEDCMKQLQALLDEADLESSTGKSATPPETKAAPSPAAAEQSTEPVYHSLLESLIATLKGA